MTDRFDELLVDSESNKIIKVLLMPRQALVTRYVKTELVEGLNKIEVGTNASGIDVNSLQASVRGQGEILGVQLKQIPSLQFAQPELATLENEKKDLEKQKRQRELEKEAAVKQKSFLDSVGKFSNVQVPSDIQTHMPSVSRLEALITFLSEKYQDVHETLFHLENQIDQISQHIQVIERKIKDKNRGKTKRKEIIEILFRSEKQHEVEIECEYLVSQASWRPIYKADVNAELDKVTLTLFAAIKQNTGEEWKDVSLKVSNAEPLNAGTLPKLSSWFLRVLPPPPPAPAAAAPLEGMALSRTAMLEETEVGAAAPAGGEVEDHWLEAAEESYDLADLAVADVQETALSCEYELPVSIDVPSGSEETINPIFVKSLDGEFFHYAIPRRDSRVYMVFNAETNTSLLAGQLNVHFDGRFITSTQLQTKKVGEDFWLNLGVDRDVSVEHKKTVDRIAETFFGMVDRHSVAKELQFIIHLENNKTSAVNLVIDDHIPISKSDRIQVKGLVTSPTPEQEDLNDKPGIYRWRMEQPAQSQNKIDISFSIKYPKDSEIDFS